VLREGVSSQWHVTTRHPGPDEVMPTNQEVEEALASIAALISTIKALALPAAGRAAIRAEPDRQAESAAEAPWRPSR
jgi:hypothetical protein